MAIEAALIKPVVDALLALFRQEGELRLKRNAEAALREAIRELLQADPNDNRAEARIAIARAAGILSEDIVLAEDMLKKHRATRSRTAGKSSSGRKRRPAEKPAPPSPSKPPAKPPAKSGTRARPAPTGHARRKPRRKP